MRTWANMGLARETRLWWPSTFLPSEPKNCKSVLCLFKAIDSQRVWSGDIMQNSEMFQLVQLIHWITGQKYEPCLEVTRRSHLISYIYGWYLRKWNSSEILNTITVTTIAFIQLPFIGVIWWYYSKRFNLWWNLFTILCFCLSISNIAFPDLCNVWFK